MYLQLLLYIVRMWEVCMRSALMLPTFIQCISRDNQGTIARPDSLLNMQSVVYLGFPFLIIASKIHL